MIRPTRCRVNQASCNPRNEKRVIDLKFDGMLKTLLVALEHVVELFGLSCRAGKAVENKTTSSASISSPEIIDLPVSTFRVVVKLALDHVDHNVITYKTTRVHDLLSFAS